MILPVAAALVFCGFITFLVGTYYQWTGIQVIGGVLILFAGGMIATEGLAVQSGAVKTTVNNTTTVTAQYEQVTFRQRMSLGGILVLLSGLLIIRSLMQAAGLD